MSNRRWQQLVQTPASRLEPGATGCCIAAPDFATAFIETIVRDRFAHRRTREVALREITERVWVRIAAEPGAPLTILDLRADGCPRIGAPTDVVQARNHAFGDLALDFQPGSHWSYGGGLQVVAHVIEIVSGMPYPEFLQTRIFDPLEMNDTHFNVPAAKMSRRVVIRGADMSKCGTSARTGRSPAAAP